MNDIMVDLETTGTDPNHSAIIQIAAVRFDYHTCQVGASFCRSLAIPGNRFWDQDTLQWWTQNGTTLSDIMAQAEDPQLVMKDFESFMMPALPGQQQRLWAKPIHFEWPFLQSYSKQFNVDLNIHYRDAIDLNSFNRGLAGNPSALPLDKQIEFDGTVHNALDDVFHQIKVAILARTMVKSHA